MSERHDQIQRLYDRMIAQGVHSTSDVVEILSAMKWLLEQQSSDRVPYVLSSVQSPQDISKLPEVNIDIVKPPSSDS
jgi:hypothetical protein